MTEQTQPDPTGTVISERDQRRILAAMMKMPYAASSRVPKPWTAMGETVTVYACSLSRPTCRRSAASSAPHPPR
jgi:hypothetical protein